ncbi:MAG: hypothetical protein NTV08_00230 [Verrucomicrobia bacterium]|nr:hypothetical protein [Verrucomicrobiota bacterium]
MNPMLALVIGLIAFLSTPVRAKEATFAGEWETTYGRMILKADGQKVSGTYEYAGGVANDISGTQDGRKLTFTYEEPGVTGEGTFTLAEDGVSFDGQWRPKGQTTWGNWSGRRSATPLQNFSGVWKSSYGMMRLTQQGNAVEGCYMMSGTARVSGTVNGDRMVFTYRELDGTTGAGEYKLSAERDKFEGRWKADGGKGGGAWTGTRVLPQAGRVWLVVLEARWESSLREQEYSYGEMMRQFFTRVPTVAVRHRYFTGRADFAKWCEELPYINEPMVFYIASHGNEKGITVGKEVLDGTFIGTQLRDAASVKLIHLGSCRTMAGTAAQDIRKASKLPAPVSGYTRTADWAGSAVIDFAYLDLVLSRHLSPAEAVRQMKDSVSFAGEQGKPGSAIAPAGLKIVE